MAAFFVDRCQWLGCGQQFGSRLELIVHIETKHIEVDRKFIEKQELAQPQCLPLSYINRFFTDSAANARKHDKLLAELGVSSGSASLTTDNHSAGATSVGTEVNSEAPPAKRRKLSSRRGSTATATAPAAAAAAPNEDGVESGEGDSDDSWSVQDPLSNDELSKVMTMDTGHEKPFRCTLPGCGKRYKNLNSIKQHLKVAHKMEGGGGGSSGSGKKVHRCPCGKSYKSSASLRQHRQVHHGEQPQHAGSKVRPMPSGAAVPATTASSGSKSVPSAATVAATTISH